MIESVCLHRTTRFYLTHVLCPRVQTPKGPNKDSVVVDPTGSMSLTKRETHKLDKVLTGNNVMMTLNFCVALGTPTMLKETPSCSRVTLWISGFLVLPLTSFRLLWTNHEVTPSFIRKDVHNLVILLMWVNEPIPVVRASFTTRVYDIPFDLLNKSDPQFRFVCSTLFFILSKVSF